VHEEVTDERRTASSQATLFRGAREPDPRWVLCHRPVVMTGGELSLDMLDLRYDSGANFYEAPAHIKATGGAFIIDDFGRQRLRAQDLVNRWILPLELGHDYLTLSTGQKIQLPFDELVVFSTNCPPEELMDEAGLRRIQYKLHVAPPSPEDYVAIFKRVCDAHDLELSPEVLSYLLEDFHPSTGTPLAGYQPKFIVEHVLARCAFDGVPTELTVERVRDALRNLVLGELSELE
jgi:predicted ATPase with chaperone activity